MIDLHKLGLHYQESNCRFLIDILDDSVYENFGLIWLPYCAAVSYSQVPGGRALLGEVQSACLGGSE